MWFLPAITRRYISGGGSCSARRAGKRDQTSRFASSVIVDHDAISSMVRQHPEHQPVAGFMRQMLVQGEGTGASGAVMCRS
ncbi:hypothetical protein A9762_22240 [Pandoraea sp. ISTKB]|nr:hypothetical protein A9762_22240 [Pandoraea sp. ISTKB]